MTETKDSLFFLGFGLPPAFRRRLQEAQILTSSSAALFGWKLVRALQSSFDVFAAVVPQVYDYPECSRLVFVSSKFEEDLVRGRALPFVNLALLKHFTRFFAALLTFLMWRRSSRKPVFVVHGLHSAFLLVGLFSKALGCRLLVVITDLPTGVVHADRNGLKALLQKVEGVFVHILVSRADAVLALAPKLVKWSGVSRSVCIPGIIDNPVPPKKKTRSDRDSFIIAYTGMLNADAGISALLRAMRHIPYDNVRLVICGDGPLKSEVVRAAAVDSRIDYLGAVSAERAYEIMLASSLLVNPRRLREDLSDASFPSKLLDYLSTSTPILSTRIESMPDWMQDALIICGDTAEEISETICRIYLEGVDMLRTADVRQSVRSRIEAEAVGRAIFELLVN